MKKVQLFEDFCKKTSCLEMIEPKDYVSMVRGATARKLGSIIVVGGLQKEEEKCR